MFERRPPSGRIDDFNVIARLIMGGLSLLPIEWGAATAVGSIRCEIEHRGEAITHPVYGDVRLGRAAERRVDRDNSYFDLK